MKIIKVGENQRIVKEKVVYYGISQTEPNKFSIWLDGGSVITNKYPDADTAKLNFEELDKIMREDEQ